MSQCKCEIIITDNLEKRESVLVHRSCGGLYDPAFILREKRSDRTGETIPGAEYR